MFLSTHETLRMRDNSDIVFRSGWQGLRYRLAQSGKPGKRGPAGWPIVWRRAESRCRSANLMRWRFF